MKYLREIKSDLPSGIIVFLVAVPLCLGIAMASGAPLFSGIISGIVGGIVVSLISGSQLGVSGPAAGLAVIVLTSIQTLGSFEVFLSAVFLAGIIQVILGLLKAGSIAYYFPSSVIKGMLSAIGIIIVLKQIPHAFGYDPDYEGDITFKQSDGENTFSELLNIFNHISPSAIIISSTSLVLIIFWEFFLSKKHKIFQLIQGPLVAVILGILFNLFLTVYYPHLALSSEHLVRLPVAQSASEFISQFTAPDFSRVFTEDVLIIAVTLAIVASLETLLCLEATDKMDPYKRISPTNRELVAQGVGNMVSGAIGGLPITQVIVRSSANIQSGGKTKLSALIHGILILLCVVTIPDILNMIPLASLAAILLIVGYKLAKPEIFRSMFKRGWNQFMPFLITILAIVFTDLLVGIGIGMVASIFFILRNHYKTSHVLEKVRLDDGREKYLITLADGASFLHKGNLLQALENVPEGALLEINYSAADSIDQDIKDLIEGYKETAKTKQIDLKVVSKKQIQKALEEAY